MALKTRQDAAEYDAAKEDLFTEMVRALRCE